MEQAFLIVDMQPAYHPGGWEVARRLSRLIDSIPLGRLIVALWVGAGITKDSEASVTEYFREHHIRRDQIPRIRFVEKDYGFFRYWMDAGVAGESIVSIAKWLREHDERDSANLDRSVVERLAPDACGSPGSIYLPATLEAEPLLQQASWLTCGGGKDQCLKEVELWLTSRGAQYERLPEYVY